MLYFKQKGEEEAHKEIQREAQRHNSEVEFLRNQLLERDKQIAEQAKQLAEKDKYIQKLQNRPTVIVDNSINVFGKESIKHITDDQIQRILGNPKNAIPEFIKIKHSIPENKNVRCINKKEGIYQKTVRQGDDIKWENILKNEVLEQLYDDNSCILEGEAVEEEHLSFLNHQDKVRASAGGEDGGRRYKEQLDKIHLILTNP